jgi:hypothetical protein
MSSITLSDLLRQIEESKALILALERKMNAAKEGQERKIRELTAQHRYVHHTGSDSQALKLSEEMKRADAEFERELNQFERDIRAVKETLEKKKRELNDL